MRTYPRRLDAENFLVQVNSEPSGRWNTNRKYSIPMLFAYYTASSSHTHYLLNWEHAGWSQQIVVALKEYSPKDQPRGLQD